MCSNRCAGDLAKTISYAEDIVECQLIARLYNPDHQHKVLMEAKRLPTLSDKVAFLDELYTTENSTNEYNARSDARSSYKKGKVDRKCECGKNIDSPNDKHTLCKACFNAKKTKKCDCGANILPSKKCCFTCGKKKKKEEEKDEDKPKSSQMNEGNVSFALNETSPDEEVVKSKDDLKDERTWARNFMKGKSMATINTPVLPHSKWNGLACSMEQPVIVAKLVVMRDAMKTWRARKNLAVGIEGGKSDMSKCKANIPHR